MFAHCPQVNIRCWKLINNLFYCDTSYGLQPDQEVYSVYSIFNECLLYVRYCFRHWRYNSKQNRQKSMPLECLYFLGFSTHKNQCYCHLPTWRRMFLTWRCMKFLNYVTSIAKNHAIFYLLFIYDGNDG